MEHLLVFVYDETGSPVALKYRTSAYAKGVYDLFFYEKNLQGDIIGIYNASGTKIGTYNYNAWGYHVPTTTSGITTLERKIVSTYNPFRYRGYYYDTETSLYYLQSRYYDPDLGRFINADGYVSTGQGLLGNNMFAYCNNNPIMYVDPTGESFVGLVVLISLVAAPVVILLDEYLGDILSNVNDISIEEELYNSDRFDNNDDAFEERGLWLDIDSAGSKNGTSGHFDAAVGLDEGTYSWDYFELEVGTAKLSGSASTNIYQGIGVSAMAEGVYASAVFNIPIFGHQLKIGAKGNLGGVGATFQVGLKNEIGISSGVGGSLIIEWD